MKKKLIEFYLDYVNNYITVEYMAGAYDITVEDCTALIEMGRRYEGEYRY